MGIKRQRGGLKNVSKMKTTLTFIENAICIYFALTPEQLFSNTRKTEIITPRQLFFYMAYKYTPRSYASIGCYAQEKELANRTWGHATVLHGAKVIAGFIKMNDRDTLKHVWKLEKIIDSEPSLRTQITNKHLPIKSF